LYSDLEFLQDQLTRKADSKTKKQGSSALVALRLDFVAKPNNYADLTSELEEVIQSARLASEGLTASILLVSDREARLVTVIGFWDCRQFWATRERCIAWMKKLMAPYADGSVRVHTSLPAFVKEGLQEPSLARTRRMGKTDFSGNGCRLKPVKEAYEKSGF